MNVDQLRAATAQGFDLGLHSHRHVNYGKVPLAQAAEDVQACVATMKSLGLSNVSALAYPFGGRPKAAAERSALIAAFRNAGVKAAFRIGNRVNPLPLRDRFEINRLGVRGDESLSVFQRKIRWGRWF
jgi:peptidoglycan/xylan/chitin deacetylase (PgdA/CDA1 family)